jgi:hypothetical protein
MTIQQTDEVIDTAIHEAKATKYAIDAILGLLDTPKPATHNPRSYYDRVYDLEKNIASSYWVRNAVHDLDRRDPTDALRDAKILVELFDLKCQEAYNEARVNAWCQ